MTAPRRPLTRTRVIETAVAMADERGIDGVSMRSLAEQLQVVPMAIYKHVSDKGDLVAGMIDTVVSAYPPPPTGLDWPAAVRWRILAAREQLALHPWLRDAIEAATQRTLAVLAYMDALAGEMMGGGVSDDLTHYAMHALGHRIWGFSPEAFATPDDTGPPPDPATLAAMAAAFPHIAAIARAAAATDPLGACDADAEFVFTLDLLLDAFGRLHRAGWTSTGDGATTRRPPGGRGAIRSAP